MTSRQRGAALVLAALVAGRILDRFDLPFEAVESAAPADSTVRTQPSPPVANLTHADSLRTEFPTAFASTRSRRSDPGHRIDPAAVAAPLRINAATAAELERLPGVGPVLAERIVADRAAHGPFRDAADLQRVRGIGPRSAARLASRLRFD